MSLFWSCVHGTSKPFIFFFDAAARLSYQVKPCPWTRQSEAFWFFVLDFQSAEQLGFAREIACWTHWPIRQNTKNDTAHYKSFLNQNLNFQSVSMSIVDMWFTMHFEKIRVQQNDQNNENCHDIVQKTIIHFKLWKWNEMINMISINFIAYLTD